MTEDLKDARQIDNRDALETTSRLVHALDHERVFGHPVTRLRFIETHISWVVLTGQYAYKIKKPVSFGFLDFSTLELRRRYCDEELRLNRRFAPQIYLGVVDIRGSPEAPRVHGDGAVIEYAVRMKEFSQQALLSAHAAAATLTTSIVDAMALRVSELHATAERLPASAKFGSVSSVRHWSEENLAQLAQSIPASSMPGAFTRLRAWYRDRPGLAQRLQRRLREGHIRECHGDLHLGNMALIDGEVLAFDCIEFNAELRCIDTISEAAFVAMDLEARGYAGYCWRFISRYLENSADYDAIDLLRYYLVYRALVRAKVEALRVAPTDIDTHGALDAAFAYIELAARWTARKNGALVIMHGLSGSGKSTIAAQLVETLGAIQLRSDVVRKQLFQLAADADSDSALDQGIYDAEATEATYRRLRQIAAQVLESDFTAIVDATFLLRSQRRQFLELARDTRCPCVVVDCDAPLAQLRSRIAARDNDPSEASLQVLERQLTRREAVTMDEPGISAIVTIGANGLEADHRDRIRTLLTS